MRRCVVIGLGNDRRGDDAAGLEVARRVGGIEHDGDLADLALDWSRDDDVVVVDAMVSGAPIGAVRRFDALAEPLPRTRSAWSSHAFDLPAALELARVLHRLPRRLAVVGIEGANFELGAAMSEEVAAAVDAVAASLAVS